MVRKFFLVTAGMFLIALSFHLGFTTATAQVVSNVTGVAMSPGGEFTFLVMTPNGDSYTRCMTAGAICASPALHIGNFWSGAPTPAQRETWGQLKARYAPSRGTAQPGADGR